MNIKNTSKFDLDTNVKAGMHSAKTQTLILAIGSPLLIIVGLLFFFLIDDKFYKVLGILCAVFGVAFLIFVSLFKLIVTAQTKKLLHGTPQDVVNFTFTETNYTVNANVNGIEETTVVDYTSILNVKEFSDMWLLFIAKGQFHVVLKSGMEQGTEEELTELLKKVSGVRYKLSYKPKKR